MSVREPKHCPRCWGWIPNNETPGAHMGALSRIDNKTEICSACGTAESLGRVAWGNPGLRDVWQVALVSGDLAFSINVELASLEGREPEIHEKLTVMSHGLGAFINTTRTCPDDLKAVDAVVIETKPAKWGEQ